MKFIEKFVTKFRETFKFTFCKNRSQLVTSKDAIQKCFESKKTLNPSTYNLVFLILFRTFCRINSIEEKSRVCIAFKPIDTKCDNILTKPKNQKPKLRKNVYDEEENATKKGSNSNKKAPAKKGGKAKNAKSKKSKEDESNNEEEQKSDEESNDANISIDGKKKLQLSSKNAVEIWSEIYLPKEKIWQCVEPISQIYDPEELSKRFYVNPLYILSFNSNGYFKDLSNKYIFNFYLNKFKKIRLEDDYLNEVYSAYRPKEPTKDELDEDELIKKNHLDKPLPKTVGDFHHHGLYALERHLLKYEIIYPEDAPVVGEIKVGSNYEDVYLRENVIFTHSKEGWKKQGRQIKEGEEPAKIVKGRPKWNKKIGDHVAKPLNCYHYDQTQEWDPGEVVDGKVPRNEFGNVDLFLPIMLPRKASYLRLNGLLKIAQKLDIDCVPAVTGFDIKHGLTVPLLDGFVVPSEYEEILRKAWTEEQEAIEKKAEEKY